MLKDLKILGESGAKSQVHDPRIAEVAEDTNYTNSAIVVAATAGRGSELLLMPRRSMIETMFRIGR